MTSCQTAGWSSRLFSRIRWFNCTRIYRYNHVTFGQDQAMRRVNMLLDAPHCRGNSHTYNRNFYHHIRLENQLRYEFNGLSVKSHT